MEMRGKNSRRERSPERGRTSSVQMHEAATTRGSSISTRMIKASPPPPPPPCFKKVQVVYYLSKNGQLEHPHFMEVTHLAHHHLRLKDVMDRLIVLRGRGMPSLYSWSYKRSYRNGYVWNDLAENDDIICPAGAEYVLKGSQLLETTYTEKYQHPAVTPQVVLLPDSSSTYHSKRKTVPSKRQDEFHNKYELDDEEEEDYYDVKTTYTAPTTPYSRCSIGVSTDEIELEQQQQQQQQNKLTHMKNNKYLSSSSPSATSSSISEKAVLNDTTTSKSDPVGTDHHSMLSPHSVLYNLIACGGGSVSFRGKSNKVPFGKGNEDKGGRKSSSSLVQYNEGVVVCKSVKAVEDDDDDEDEIRCMSENPRFGNPQSEEKEYFSGSIVDAICEDERVKVVPAAVLRKSSSHNEERSCKAGVDVVGEEKEMMKEREKDGRKGKCIPKSKKSSTSCLSSFI